MDESIGSIATSVTSKDTKDNSIYCGFSPPFHIISKEQIEKILKAINANLSEIINNNQHPLKYYGYIYKVQKDIFYLPTIPKISLEDYINRIFTKTKMDISTLISAIIYIDQFCENYKYFLTLHNIHRILLSACLLSIKFNEDNVFKYDYYSHICGVSIEDLNQLEYTMFVALDFNLYIEEDYYQKYFDYFLGMQIKEPEN